MKNAQNENPYEEQITIDSDTYYCNTCEDFETDAEGNYYCKYNCKETSINETCMYHSIIRNKEAEKSGLCDECAHFEERDGYYCQTHKCRTYRNSKCNKFERRQL